MAQLRCSSTVEVLQWTCSSTVEMLRHGGNVLAQWRCFCIVEMF